MLSGIITTRLTKSVPQVQITKNVDMQNTGTKVLLVIFVA